MPGCFLRLRANHTSHSVDIRVLHRINLSSLGYACESGPVGDV